MFDDMLEDMYKFKSFVLNIAPSELTINQSCCSIYHFDSLIQSHRRPPDKIKFVANLEGSRPQALMIFRNGIGSSKQAGSVTSGWPVQVIRFYIVEFILPMS